jgi:putative membrane protein
MARRDLAALAEEVGRRAAVAEAERDTAAEVVLWLEESCDAHPEGPWKGAAAGGLVAVVVGWASHWILGAWGGAFFWTVLPALGGTLAGYALGSWPPVQRWLVGPAMLDERVRRAAEAAFLRAEAFATRERTGVLLFVAFREHRVVVIADSGIRARVAEGAWQAVSDGVVAAIRRNDVTTGLVEGLHACGRILREHGVAPAPGGDVNELPDQPRVGGPRR